jgi:predicted Zn-dependent protease
LAKYNRLEDDYKNERIARREYEERKKQIVAKLELLGTGVNLGVVLLEQLFPGSSALTPIAGNLITRGYSRSEEFAADRHGVEILRRAGYSKQVMIDALDWISRTGGSTGGGGFLSTHPATAERIQELRRMA